MCTPLLSWEQVIDSVQDIRWAARPCQQIDRPTWLQQVVALSDCCAAQVSSGSRVEAAYQRFAPYRDSSMDRWHRKTMLMTGSGALRSNLKALNQSLSARVRHPSCNTN